MTRDEAGEGSKAPIMESLVYPFEDCSLDCGCTGGLREDLKEEGFPQVTYLFDNASLLKTLQDSFNSPSAHSFELAQC